MCGLCNLFRCGSRRREDCGVYRLPRREPCMKTHCASGLGTRSACPCVRDDSCECNNCNRREECRDAYAYHADCE